LIWLPNVGFGTLPPTMETYFREGLSEATGSDKGRAILFYCRERCWMSWNAAKRAIAQAMLEAASASGKPPRSVQ
jgi:PQQ-dependent catabolism-associated CXXCW motif protein